MTIARGGQKLGKPSPGHRVRYDAKAVLGSARSLDAVHTTKSRVSEGCETRDAFAQREFEGGNRCELGPEVQNLATRRRPGVGPTLAQAVAKGHDGMGRCAIRAVTAACRSSACANRR